MGAPGEDCALPAYRPRVVAFASLSSTNAVESSVLSESSSRANFAQGGGVTSTLVAWSVTVPRTAYWFSVSQYPSAMAARACTLAEVERFPPKTWSIVTWTQTLLELIRAAAPELSTPFEEVRRRLGKHDEAQVIEHVYAQVAPVSFSYAVLARVPRRLAALRVKDVEWSDWGNAKRVVETLRRIDHRPSWFSRLEPLALEEPA